MMAFFRHLDEATLAEVAELGRSDQLKAPDRLHLEGCDRCQRLVAGHERASRLLSAPWRLVPAAEMEASGITAVRPRIATGSALQRTYGTDRALWLRAVIVLGAALLLVLAALLVASSRPPLPTSTRLMFPTEQFEYGPFMTVDLDGSNPQPIPVEGGGWTTAATWSPDGSRLAYLRSSGESLELVIVAAEALASPWTLEAVRPVLDEPGPNFQWSPDGTSLAGWDQRGLVVVDAVTGVRRLTVPVWGRQLSWSPDGSRILYARGWSYEEGRSAGNLGVVDVTTGENVRLLHADKQVLVRVSPDAWSPDGSQLVFYGETALPDPESCCKYVDPRVFVMRADGTGLRELVAGSDPSWSPEGGWIVFEADFEPFGVWVIRPDGSGLRFIGDGQRPRWSPDGRQIAYCGEDGSGYFVADVVGGAPRLVYEISCWYGGTPEWQPTAVGG